MMTLGKYSIGIGDRFGQQGEAQLAAIMQLQEKGIDVTPVWNKSHREHTIIKTNPADTRTEADNAVKALSWKKAYFVDADHVGMRTIDLFIDSSDFFTLDVADFIGKPAQASDLAAFVAEFSRYAGELVIPGIDEAFHVSGELIEQIGGKYLYGVQEAGRIYRYLLGKKPADSFVVEVSMDETDEPQTPVEMFFILAAIAKEGIPARTIAPKFTGRFNKGVDYVGDIDQFSKEFDQDLAVIQFAVEEFSLPAALKLSVHSGSDKFSLYRPIKKAVQKYNAGLHLKTAGTTWLEELIGLAIAGGEGLQIAQEVYRTAFSRYDELCKPYATVIDIDRDKLPSPDKVDQWDGQRYAGTLKHDQARPDYNPNFRQILHVGYKIAAEMGERYTLALRKYKRIIGENVTENIYQRHLKPLFLSD